MSSIRQTFESRSPRILLFLIVLVGHTQGYRLWKSWSAKTSDIPTLRKHYLKPVEILLTADSLWQAD